MNDELSLEENIKRCFLEPSSPLFEEPYNLLKQEVREPAIYNAIITSIATGSTKLSEISSKVEEETSACAVYKKISPKLSDYMGAVFEDICIQYLWKLREQGKVEIEFNNLGRWWGNDSKNKCEAEIDIMGIDGTDSALFCECKWTNEKVDVGVLDTLVDCSQLFHYKYVQLYLFAKNGFTKGCAEKANELGNVILITFNDIFHST